MEHWDPYDMEYLFVLRKLLLVLSFPLGLVGGNTHSVVLVLWSFSTDVCCILACTGGPYNDGCPFGATERSEAN